ncbi:hypothetical protein KSP40_PGU007379 [Platanthera guangdongensis]|uniref:UmuC domain-containing protein n=1 Tax=Platanthera guangdongensis TaxID=2320717 RepID=A0ABR2MIS2_9ASPA
MATSSEGDRPWQSYNTAYTNAKAGMDGVDKEKVQRVVYEMSKGSKYFENEQRKEAFIKQKIENLRAQVDLLTDKDISHFQMVAVVLGRSGEEAGSEMQAGLLKGPGWDAVGHLGVRTGIIELEASRDLSKIWLHVDMDAFYAAVETLENPSLRGRPMAVGGLSMISTANYEARRYDPDFFATSLDEAYLNITEVCISSDEVASELRNAIFEETGLTCSAGVAPNRIAFLMSKNENKMHRFQLLTPMGFTVEVVDGSEDLNLKLEPHLFLLEASGDGDDDCGDIAEPYHDFLGRELEGKLPNT